MWKPADPRLTLLVVDHEEFAPRAVEAPQGGRRGGPGGGAGSGEPAESVSSVERLDALVARAGAEVPGWTAITLQIPTADDAPVSLAVDRGDGGQPPLRSTVTFDRATGAGRRSVLPHP